MNKGSLLDLAAVADDDHLERPVASVPPGVLNLVNDVHTLDDPAKQAVSKVPPLRQAYVSVLSEDDVTTIQPRSGNSRDEELRTKPCTITVSTFELRYGGAGMR